MEPYKETVDAVISEYQADLDNGLTENSVEEKMKKTEKINLKKRRRNHWRKSFSIV